MDGFVDNFGDADADPAAEFLAREQDQLAGLEDELKPVSSTQPIIDGAFPVDGSFLPQDVNHQIDPASSFEMIDSFGQQNGFPSAMGSEGENSTPEERVATELDEDGFPSPAPAVSKPVVKEEPEKIKKWREEQKKRLEEKDANEETRKEEMRLAAKKELEEWYRHHEEQITRTKTANRNAEKQFVAEAGEIEPGTEWERIAKLCEFNPKSSKTSRDVSRMRSIILQLKQAPPTKKA
ncbi:clathrin light chain isoform X2 [Bacillus rossius redtenbacheri]|uniref:clathrin light chain isoform X2 n=1 Tax=Bacillus rossius redtenbacheri TaxID=93214 RepID=UPI002FDD576C